MTAALSPLRKPIPSYQVFKDTVFDLVDQAVDFVLSKVARRVGTLDMIARCREAGLPEPDFEQRGGHWAVTLWRDWLTTDDQMERLKKLLEEDMESEEFKLDPRLVGALTRIL